MMSFLSTVVSSRFPTTNNQLRNSSNPIQQVTIHDGRMTVQPVQGRQTSFATGMSGTRANVLGTGGNNSGQQRFVKCFNYQGEVLNEEELEFLADSRIAECPVTHTIITHNVAYQADDLDAYDSDNDDFSIAKAVLMANLSSYRSDILSKDTNSSAQQDAMILSVFEQLSNQVTNCNKVNNDNLIANESLSAELKRYKERVKLLEERQNVDLSTREKLIIDDIIWEKNAQFADFEKEINYLKQTLSEQSKEKELLTKTFNVFKNKSNEKEAKNIDTEISLKKKVKELDNIVCKMGQSTQTVHMLTKPQVFYDNNLKQALGSGPGLQCMTHVTSSSGLVPNHIPQQPCIPPPRDDWDRLFQPVFDEYFNPPTILVSPVPVATAPRTVDFANSPVTTSIDQDALSTSIPSTQDQEHSLIISQGFCRKLEGGVE
ncbi:hypothetical protein Tco_1045589 [Tanacetum coccineum]|uniref:Uncharacterized protein n=1 Tax=Tanacetum coccineum TaxID=301880 RepID=A0ABQ5GTS6_9ASTR